MDFALEKKLLFEVCTCVRFQYYFQKRKIYTVLFFYLSFYDIRTYIYIHIYVNNHFFTIFPKNSCAVNFNNFFIIFPSFGL